MKKLLAIFLSAAMMLSLTACDKPTPTAEPTVQDTQKPTPTPEPTATPTPEPEPVKIGVAMPTKDLQRWNQDGDNMRRLLEEMSYEVDLQYADDDIDTQVSQVENMVAGGCKILIIAAIEASSLSTVLDNAKAKGVKIIAYDRLILNTDAVSYYVTFDNYMVGTLQGEYIRDALKLDETDGSFNIELITGDPGDSSSRSPFFYGAMDVLQPYIDSGKLVVPSGQKTFEQIATAGWRTENAQARFDDIIANNYLSGKKLDAVMASNDSTAQGVTNALLAAGYTKENFPIITGQDCDYASAKNMFRGHQSMSVFKETRTLAAKAVEMADAIVRGTKVPVNDTKTYDNGKGIVNTYLCAPVVVTVDNFFEYFSTPYYSEWFEE